MNPLVQIADAVVAELNGPELALGAERAYVPAFELEEMDTLRVTVVPKSTTESQHSRSISVLECKVDVAVQKRVPAGDTNAVDELMQLVNRIAAQLRRRKLAHCPEAVWIGTEYPAVFAPEHLAELHQFTSVLTLSYRILG